VSAEIYVRNAWYVAAWNTHLPVGKPAAISVLGEPIVLYRSASGRLVALEDRCVHRLAPLSLGRCEGERLRCMYHGLLYDADGRVIEIPGQAQIAAQARVRSYAVVERHSWIWVWMGDPSLADATLIPSAVGLDDPAWVLGTGQLDYAAEARLINDNLLDFSHLPYVHAASFGAPEVFATERPITTALPRGVRFERWVVNRQRMFSKDANALVDNWSSYDFVVPGVLLMWNGSFPAGTARACNFTKPDYQQALCDVTFTSQAVTPLTENTARYFFSWGPHCAHGDEARRDLLMGIASQAFGEDKVMIEAQQRVIDRTANPQIMPTTADKGVTLYGQIVRRLIAAEATSPTKSFTPAATPA